MGNAKEVGDETINDIFKRIIALLDDEDWYVKNLAIININKLSSRIPGGKLSIIIEKLVTLSKSDNQTIRSSVAQTLGSLKNLLPKHASKRNKIVKIVLELSE